MVWQANKALKVSQRSFLKYLQLQGRIELQYEYEVIYLGSIKALFTQHGYTGRSVLLFQA